MKVPPGYSIDAVDYCMKRYFSDPEEMAGLLEEIANDEIARQAYALRTAAGLAEKELAKLIGVKAADITRLEDNDYEGNMFALLWRIAKACGRDVRITFPASKESPRPRKAVAPNLKALPVSETGAQAATRRAAR